MKDLQKVGDALNLMTDVYYKATINHLRVFLYVAANNDAVLETRDLPEALGMTQTTLNRTMRSMADRSYIHENGFKILRVSTHPTDERQRIVELTPKGKELAINMQRIIYDG